VLLYRRRAGVSNPVCTVTTKVRRCAVCVHHEPHRFAERAAKSADYTQPEDKVNMRGNVVLRGGLVFDGTGAPARRVDVAVHDGTIAAVGPDLPADGADTIALDGLVVAPGFIDVHTHDDRLLLADPSMTPKLSQGVTTVVTGNCGVSLAPLGMRTAVPPLNLVAADAQATPAQRFASFRDYFAALEAAPPAINCAALVGHTTLRVTAMDALDRAATATEIAAMRAGVDEALAAGAIGVSTGTYYAPARAATADEIRQVFEPLRGTDALIASHIRDEGERVLESMTEAMEIAASLGVRQVLSHHKVIGRANFGRSRETLALLDAARRTRDVCLDCYPYTASSTVLRRDAAAQAERVLIAWSQARPDAAGRYLDELAAETGDSVDATIDALQPAGAIYFSMDEADVERILAYPETMVGSDGLPHDAFPHPRLWGAFPRVLGHYAQRRRLFPLEEAVHRMTGLPADRFRLAGRGRIAPGCAADLVVFDPERIADTATFAHPKTPAAGIHSVYVNGALAWSDGRATGARRGRVLRRAH
jgi:N-acyl-D-amino-acid deacylase